MTLYIVSPSPHFCFTSLLLHALSRSVQAQKSIVVTVMSENTSRCLMTVILGEVGGSGV
jgi:hypothetical protein